MIQIQVVCESYAVTVFSKADEEDRDGYANKETARQFYNGIDPRKYIMLRLLICVASTFFDILDQFGDVDDEVF
jgi:hypothetical protein